MRALPFILLGLVLILLGVAIFLLLRDWARNRGPRLRDQVEEARRAGREDLLDGYLSWAQGRPVEARGMWDRLSADLRADVVRVLAPTRDHGFDASAALRRSGQYKHHRDADVRLAYLDGADQGVEEISQATIAARSAHESANRTAARISAHLGALRELDSQAAERQWKEDFGR